MVPAEEVRNHQKKFGLQCKAAEHIGGGADGVRMLGIRVHSNKDGIWWRRDNDLGDVPDVITRRSIFSMCGRIVSHLPVCGPLRVAAAYLKRKANAVSSSWDSKIDDERVIRMARDLMQRVRESDPSQGRWDVDGKTANVWVDASSLALGAMIEVDGHIVEDASWLRKDEAMHINMAELDAAQKGINLALLWGMETIQLMTDSKVVFGWLTDVLTGKSRVKTKASCEMLIRRRLGTIKSTVEECGLQLNVRFVNSAENRADALTRIPHKWLNDGHALCAAVVALSDNEIRRVHETCGHPGVKRTLYFARKRWPQVNRKQVRQIISSCEACQSLDPSTVHWRPGRLDVAQVWKRTAMDITHINGVHYLTLIDCGPSRFAIWRRLQRQDSFAVIQVLENLFCERGAPEEILTDNATSFRSSAFEDFAKRWSIRMLFRCAHYPEGNGIAERSHRTVKRIAARSGCSVEEAVYWHNISPRDDTSAGCAPANQMYR